MRIILLSLTCILISTAHCSVLRQASDVNESNSTTTPTDSTVSSSPTPGSTPSTTTRHSSPGAHTTTSTSTVTTTTGATPSPIAQGNHEPKMPSDFGHMSATDLLAVKTLCTKLNGGCMNQSESAASEYTYVKRLWETVLMQSMPYKTNAKLASTKAAVIMRKVFIAKYIQMRLFGFPAKLAIPKDNGLFEGDVMLPELATDAIIQAALSWQSELRADDELNGLLAEYDRDFGADGEKLDTATDTRSALAVDQFRVVAWTSTIYFHIDVSISKENAAIVRDAFKMIANRTCLRFVERPVVPEFQLVDTLVIFPMPTSTNGSIPSCVASSFGRMSLNFVFVNFSCENATGELLHGVMHALGVSHEHNRIDRDEYVSIQWQKLQSSYLDFFAVDVPRYQTTFGTQFDFDSVMFYPSTIGAEKSGDQTIVPKTPTTSRLGQRDHLSCGDVAILKRMYCCSSPVCTDRKPMCGIYATKRLCSSKDNWFWLKNNCAKSCNYCCPLDCGTDCADFCK